MILATSENVIGAAFAVGVLVGAAIVLVTIWVMAAIGEPRRYR